MENILTARRPTTAFFTDNIIIQTNPGYMTDGCTFPPIHADPDYAKGIYNLRPRSGAPAPASLKHDEAMPQTGKTKRPRNSLKKRLLVNARERERMRVLNNAFQSLRDALPCYIADGHMAKITTLRLAINYIKALTEVLDDEGPSSVTTRYEPASLCGSGRPTHTTTSAPESEIQSFLAPVVNPQHIVHAR